jgi:hypothetical protein
MVRGITSRGTAKAGPVVNDVPVVTATAQTTRSEVGTMCVREEAEQKNGDEVQVQHRL